MFRVLNEYLGKITVKTDNILEQKLNICLNKPDLYEKTCVNVNYNRYIVDIRLKSYSVEVAEDCFKQIMNTIAYSYSSMYVRYNEGDRVRYRLATSKEDKTGVYLDIIFS